jgi:hypothetical protein
MPIPRSRAGSRIIEIDWLSFLVSPSWRLKDSITLIRGSSVQLTCLFFTAKSQLDKRDKDKV